MKNKDLGYAYLKNSDERENCFGNFGKESLKNVCNKKPDAE